MTATTDAQIATAACSTVVAINPAILPQGALTAPASVGDQTITVSSTTGILPKSIVSWWDGSAEAPLAVKSVTPTSITLDFTGQPYTGLQHTHSEGAVVASNILDALPVDLSDMRRSGWPVISCFPTSKSGAIEMMRGVQPDHALQVVYQLAAKQPTSGNLPAELWFRNQLQRMVADLSALETAFSNNPTLNSDQTGPTISGLKRYRRSLRTVMVKDTIPHYEVTFLFDLTGAPITQHF